MAKNLLHDPSDIIVKLPHDIKNRNVKMSVYDTRDNNVKVPYDARDGNIKVSYNTRNGYLKILPHDTRSKTCKCCHMIQEKREVTRNRSVRLTRHKNVKLLPDKRDRNVKLSCDTRNGCMKNFTT